MRRIEALLQHYHSYHTKRVTEITHYVGVPMVAFSLLILLSWVHLLIPPFFSISFAWLLVAAALGYYFYLDWQIAAVMTAIIVPLTFLAKLIAHPAPQKFNMAIFLILFIGGSVFQIAGHLYEGKRPALTDNLWQIFAAPLFLLVKVLNHFGYRKDLSLE